MHTITIVGLEANGTAEALSPRRIPSHDFAIFSLDLPRYRQEHPNWVRMLVSVEIGSNPDD